MGLEKEEIMELTKIEGNLKDIAQNLHLIRCELFSFNFGHTIFVGCMIAITILVLTWLVLVAPRRAEAQEAVHDPANPKVTITLAEGYSILFKDGLTPGPVSTRFMVGLGWKIDNGWGIGCGFGIATPNNEFKPNPRIGLSANRSLTDRISLNAGVLYQFNYGYTGKEHAHFVGGSLGVRMKILSGLTLGFDVGPGKNIGAKYPWGLLFQPSVSCPF